MPIFVLDTGERQTAFLRCLPSLPSFTAFLPLVRGPSSACLPGGSRPCSSWLSLGKQASGFMLLLSRHSRKTEDPWRRSTRGPGSLLQNLRPTCSGLVPQELTPGGDPEVLKVSLVRETGGGTVGVSLDNPTEERCLPLSGRSTNLQFYDTLRLQRKPASPSKEK